MAIDQLKGKPWYIGLAAGAGVAAVLFGLAWWQLINPKRVQIDGLQRQLAGLQEKIQEGRAAKQRLPQFREEVRRLELELDKLLRILPARLNTEDLLRRLRSLAEQGDLDLLRIRPAGLNNRDFYAEWPINLEVSGTYHTLAMFFDRIGRFSRIINIEDLTVGAKDPRQNRGHTISATFMAKTFIYREVEVQPEAPTTNRPGPGRPRGPA
jgi:type IV pilus assembly protein PilO